LHAEKRGLVEVPLETGLWQSYLSTDHLYSEQWLLCYEAGLKGWLKATSGADHIGADANLRWLRDLGVEFYDVDKASAVGLPGCNAIDWLVELEQAIQARLESYGESDEDRMDEGVDVTDLSVEDESLL
jgi:hypothetical protein